MVRGHGVNKRYCFKITVSIMTLLTLLVSFMERNAHSCESLLNKSSSSQSSSEKSDSINAPKIQRKMTPFGYAGCETPKAQMAVCSARLVAILRSNSLHLPRLGVYWCGLNCHGNIGYCVC